MLDAIKRINWKKIILYSFIALLVITVTFSLFNSDVLADVGNNNRYEEDGNTGDYSGIIGFFIYVLFGMFGPLPGIILVAGVIITFFILKKKGKLDSAKKKINDVHRNIRSTLVGPMTLDNGVNVEAEVRKIDPAFSEDAFVGWVREVFIKIQEAWSTRNWKIIRPFESNELFSQHTTQLQEFINQNKINVIEKVAVKQCVLKEFKQDGDKEVMVVELHAIMRDYVIDATTKRVLESNPNKDWYIKYRMVFNRKTGVKTQVGMSNKSTTNCPNCGAPTEITSSGQCQYCGSVITTGEHDWVLSDISSIK